MIVSREDSSCNIIAFLLMPITILGYMSLKLGLFEFLKVTLKKWLSSPFVSPIRSKNDCIASSLVYPFNSLYPSLILLTKDSNWYYLWKKGWKYKTIDLSTNPGFSS